MQQTGRMTMWVSDPKNHPCIPSLTPILRVVPTMLASKCKVRRENSPNSGETHHHVSCSWTLKRCLRAVSKKPHCKWWAGPTLEGKLRHFLWVHVSWIFFWDEGWSTITQAEQFALIFMQCCESRRRRRPKMKEVVLPYLQILYSKALDSLRPSPQ